MLNLTMTWDEPIWNHIFWRVVEYTGIHGGATSRFEILGKEFTKFPNGFIVVLYVDGMKVWLRIAKQDMDLSVNFVGVIDGTYRHKG